MRQNWSRDELIAALNLYYKIPFSKITHNHILIIELAKLIGRTPSAVSLKLGNFARLDPTLRERHISGMSHGSRQDIEIWQEFFNNIEDLAFQSEKIIAKYRDSSVENSTDINLEDLPKEGKERESIVKTRVNQSFFRKAILASYDFKCCITGLTTPDLLVASHIIPWSDDKANRMNPCNGLCLNALHDKAFDIGLITVTPDCHVQISKALQKIGKPYQTFFEPYDQIKITLSQRFLPKPEFFEWHNRKQFVDSKERNVGKAGM
jgi:putative restriction endonuclease